MCVCVCVSSTSSSWSWRLRHFLFLDPQNGIDSSISSSVILCSFVLLVYNVTLVLVTYFCPSSVRVVATFPGTVLFPLLYSVLPFFPLIHWFFSLYIYILYIIYIYIYIYIYNLKSWTIRCVGRFHWVWHNLSKSRTEKIIKIHMIYSNCFTKLHYTNMWGW